jgi:hypothetical protein
MKKLTTEEFIEKARIVHSDKYNYDLVNYIKSVSNVTIICSKHGKFEQKPNNHLNGMGCRKCGMLKLRKDRAFSLQEFIEKSNKIHKNKYDYSKSVYDNAHSKLLIKCPHHGFFEQIAHNHLMGKGCNECTHKVSKAEIELQRFVENLSYKLITSDRKLIQPYELDIYIPELNKAIEFNGLYWHYSKDKFVPGKHGNKSNLCRSRGIKLLHVREELWIKNKHKMKQAIIKFLKL